MKKKLTILVLALLTASFTYAINTTPDSMYIHFTASDDTDSIVVHALADIDSIVYYASEVSTPPSVGSTFTDSRDNHVYPIVTIGTQTWMAANLQYPSGTHIEDADTWAALGDNNTDAAYCYYNNNADGEKATYGALYTYAAALSACPTGWHLPSDAEWKTLEMYIGMSETEADDFGLRGTDEGEKLKSTSGWNSSGNGTDDYGFAALPGGCRYYDGAFYGVGYGGSWWSNTELSSSYACRRYLRYGDSSVYRSYYSKSGGYSVRCLRD